MNETGDATSALITAAWALCYSKLVVLGAVLALSPFNFMVILRTSVGEIFY
jgi:hypothetical protein